jgi:hypothetical protein
MHAAYQTKAEPSRVLIAQETNDLALMVQQSAVINANDIS